MQINPRQIKFIGVIVVVFIISCIIYFTYQAIDRSNKIKVNVATIPSDAEITVNKKNVSNGTVYLKPGKYTVVVEKSGFTTYTEQSVISKDNNTIDVGLNPESSEAKLWVDTNSDLYTALERRVELKLISEGVDFKDKNPITAKLPFKNLLFTIGYFVDTTDSTGNSIFVTIDAPEGYRQAAVNKINDLGFNPAELNIIFVGYDNQFAL